MPLDSGAQKVKPMPRKLQAARMKSEFRTPMPALYPWSTLAGSLFCARYRNPNDPTMAPSFPAAAEMPWHVDRSLAGKISAGTMKVVELGPKLAKKKVSAYSTTNPMWFPGVVQW
uniref:Uncharacterized protein n=1 Tax=Triticum urartu TaxID=4572 RepID=A0A8R7UKG4_TRIUA